MENRFYNIEAEAQILGAIFMDNNAIIKIDKPLKVNDFYDVKHKLIFKAMGELFNEGKPIDPVTLVERLQGNLENAGGISYISKLAAMAFSLENLNYYGEIIREKARRRLVYTVLKNSMKEIESGSREDSEIVNSLVNEVMVKDSDSIPERDMITIVGDYIDYVERVNNDRDAFLGVRTGKGPIDEIIGGFNKQDLVIIAGRPSMGKSMVGLNLAFESAFRAHGRSLFFSLEMSKTQCMDRLMGIVTGIPIKHYKEKELSDKQWDKVLRGASVITQIPMVIYDDIYSLEDIISECRRVKLQKGLDVVFIDYIQIVGAKLDSRVQNRTQELGKISRALKLLAKELDITVVIMSQLSRGTEARSDHKPGLGDLRESGNLEQDADIVMAVFRESYYSKDCEEDALDVIVLKNRNGEVGTARFKWDGATQTIY